MFVQQKEIRKIRAFLTPRRLMIWGVIILLIIACVSIYIYWLRSKRAAFLNKKNLFEALIYDYSLERFKLSDDKIRFFTQSFKFDTIMLTPAELGVTDDRKDWFADSETFGTFVNTIYSLMSATIDPKSSFYKSGKIWNIIIHMIREVEAKLPSVPEKFKFVWDSNWFQFSISYPLFLVSVTYMYRRLFKRDDEFLIRHLASYIANYYEDPVTAIGILSTGWLRDGPNAIMMAVPYIGGHLFLNDWNPDTTSMRYVKKYITLQYVNSGNGFYYDGTFVFHTVLRAYGYLTSSYLDFVLISKFLNNHNTVKAINSILGKTEHPTIPLHFGPWFSRTSSQSTNSRFNKFGKLGFFTLDHMRGVIAKKEDWIIAFNGQQPDLCYYESDGSNYSWAQYWTMARRFMYKDTPKRIYKQLIPYYPGVWSYGRQAIDIKSETTTTETHMPEVAKAIICQLGDEALAMLNRYIVNMAGNSFDVYELTLITRNGVHCYYRVKPNLSQAASNTLTLGVQVDDLATEGSRLAGEGATSGKRFKNSCAFVYPGELGKVESDEIDDPDNETRKLTTLYIEPRLDPLGSQCGFSHVHTESGHNELIKPPTINEIETSDMIVVNSTKHPELLVLYNKITKTAAISVDMGNTYRTDLSLRKSNLDEIFESGYRVENSSFISNSYKLNILNGGKYQAIITNANLKIAAS